MKAKARGRRRVSSLRNSGRRRRAGFDNSLRSAENCAMTQLSWPDTAAGIVCAVAYVSPFLLGNCATRQREGF